MKTIILILVLLCINCTSSLSQYLRYQKIVGGEYFFNSDPGEGNGTWIQTDTLNEVSVNVPIGDVPVGTSIYIRFKSTNGTWSGPRCILRREYFTNSGANLTYGEYFINTDLGRGNGTPIGINPDRSIILNNPPLKRGDKAFFRVRDSFNRWSPARAATFLFQYIDSAVCYVKYYSGGQSSVASMTVSSPNDSNAVFTADRNNIAPIHDKDTVLVRFQTVDHFWSYWKSVGVIYQSARLVIQPDTIDLGIVGAGDSVVKTIQLIDNSSTPLRLDSVKVPQFPFWADISVPVTINGFDTLNVTVIFKPTSNGSVHDSLVLFSTGGIEKIYLKGLVTGVKQIPDMLPMKYQLSQSYPNPFNPSSIIHYELPERNQVILKVYNLLGQEIAMLVNEYQPAGYYDKQFDASGLPSGIYIYRIFTSSGFSETRKMLLLR
jgi:hypothetical protein